MKAANDNSKRIAAPVSIGALAIYAGRRFSVEIPGCPVTVTKLTTRSGRTQGFELAHNGAILAVLGARATYANLEAACASFQGLL
jgi:hypothetical protein